MRSPAGLDYYQNCLTPDRTRALIGKVESQAKACATGTDFRLWLRTMAATTEATKTLSDNRQAGHNFFLTDRYEAGMVLTGTEVKAAKSGKVQLRDAYAMIDRNEAWLHNAHISEYSHGNRENHPPVRARKLLLHRREIDKLLTATREKGLSLIPTRMYLKNGRIKCEIAIAKGKKFHDKREAERAKGDIAEAREAIRASKARTH